MPELLHPGIYTVEKPSGSMPIEGVGTNTAAFIGYAKSGPFGEPTLITSWSQFCRLYGEDETQILGLLETLGKTPWDSIEEKRDLNKDTWVEYLRYVYLEQDDYKFLATDEKIKAWRQYVKANSIQEAPSPYIEFKAGEIPGLGENEIANGYMALAVRGYFDNGGSRAYIVRVARKTDFKAHKGSSPEKLRARFPETDAQAMARIGSGAIVAKAQQKGESGNNLQLLIEAAPKPQAHAAPPKTDAKTQPGKTDGPTVDAGKPEGDKDNGPTQESAAPADTYVITVMREGSEAKQTKTVTLKELETKKLSFLGIEIETQGRDLTTLAKQVGTSVALVGGSDGHPSSLGNVKRPDDFEGDEVELNGRRGLKPFPDINMVCIPDLMAGILKRRVVETTNGIGMVEQQYQEEDLNTSLYNNSLWKMSVRNGQQGMVDYCELANDRMAILDPLPQSKVQDIYNDVYDTDKSKHFPGASSNYSCSNGQAALYYPWLKVADPVHAGYQVFVPPCGHVAGVWARVVTERGVHKAPANEALRGVVSLEAKISDGDQDVLNPVGINCIRNFPGQGIRIWGGRTLATKSNQSYRYVNVRRLVNYLKKSLEGGLQWAVFEPNDEDLWGRVSRNVSAFLFTEWKDGKLFGSVPEQAYFVQCNASNNPQEMIDQGRVNVEIGINPVKPAEFIVLTIGQWDGGSSSSERG